MSTLAPRAPAARPPVPGRSAAARGVAHPTRFAHGVILLLVGFLLIFPKGGMKVAGVPFTWGYLLLALYTLSLPLTLLLGWARRVRRERLVLLALLVPFQAIVWFSLVVNGVRGLGFTISLLVSFFLLPVALVLAAGVDLDRLHLGFLFRLLKLGILAVAVYGIFLFLFKLKTGRFVEVPYLTVAAGDVGLEDKYINRGGIFKLISTYNNGNIYGVSILVLLPLYSWLERSWVKKGVVKLSLLLTLSRTVWVGLILHELLQRVYVRRISPRSILLLIGSLVATVFAVWLALDLMGRNVGFLLDRQLGGRIGQLSVLDGATLLPAVPFDAILEIVYLSVLYNFGLLGLAGFLLAMTAPLALVACRVVPFGSTEYKRSLAAGLLTYLVVAASDGAILYIPVMAFYWFAVSLLLSDNPSFREAAAGARAPLGT